MRRFLFAALVALGTAAGLLRPVEADATYRVQPGDTLSDIADRFGLTVEELANANGIADWDWILWGTELRIPQGVRGLSYTVQPGDNLSAIAEGFGVSVEDLIRSNPQISDPDVIYPGQIIWVPHAREDSSFKASSQPVRALIARHAQEYRIDPHLVEALAWQESGWQQDVMSGAGAVGIMQIMPDTARWLSAEVLGRPLDVVGSASDNVLAGTAYLNWLLTHASSTEEAVAAYYQGLGSIRRMGLLPETYRFVENVMAIYRFILRTGGPPAP